MSQAEDPATPGRHPLDRLVSVLEVVAAVAIVLMMVHSATNAMTRSWLDYPLPGTTEYVAFWYMPLIVFTGFVAAQYRHKHIEVDLVLPKMHSTARKLGLRLAWLTAAAVMAMLAWGTWTEAIHNFDVKLTSGIVAVTIWPFTFLAPLAFAVLTLQLLLRVIRPIEDAEEALHPKEAGVL